MTTCDFGYPDGIEHLVSVLFTNTSIVNWAMSPATIRTFLPENTSNVA